MTQPGAEVLGMSDAEIDGVVQYADPMALRGLLYQLTGDEEVRAGQQLLPERARPVGDQRPAGQPAAVELAARPR